MVSRRRFVAGTVTLALVPLTLACSSDGDDGDDGGDGGGGSGGTGGNGGTACDGLEASSSVNSNHLHTVCIDAADLTDPPTDGATYTTSLDDGHTHELVLSATQLADIERGTTVIATTTSDQMHTHQFTLVR